MNLERLTTLFSDRQHLLGELAQAKTQRETHAKQVVRYDKEITDLDQRIFVLERKIEEEAKKG